MSEVRGRGKILIVDDEWGLAIVRAVQRRLESEGWHTIAVEPETRRQTGDEFEEAALYAIEEEQPDGVLLDVRFGEHEDDRFKGLGILRQIVEHHPKLLVLIFTQYAQGPERDTAVTGALRWDAPVDFIDKLASPEEVVRRIVDKYTAVASEIQKEISWWLEPTEFGIIYTDSSAIEHVATNLLDNAVRFATSHIEIKLTKNPSYFFIRVWDDGPGIAPQYLQHIFDRGWTPEIAVDADTEIEDAVAVGQLVEVEAEINPDGSLLAVEVEVEEEDQEVSGKTKMRGVFEGVDEETGAWIISRTWFL